MRTRLLPANEHRRERWRNGLGWTREIVREPDVRDGWAWRASVAEIDADCAFSRFPGCDRALVLLSGEGLALQLPDGIRELEPPHGRVEFAGEPEVQATVRGRVEVFNLIWRRGSIRAQLLHRPLVGPMVFFPEPGVDWLLYVLRGRALLKDRPDSAPSEAGDARLLQPERGGAGRCILDGGGEILLARIESVAR